MEVGAKTGDFYYALKSHYKTSAIIFFYPNSDKRREGEYWGVSEEHVTSLLRNRFNYTTFTQV